MEGKKKYLLVVILLLVMFGLGSFVTYSIFRTSTTGSGSLDTAKWSVVVKKGATSVTNLNFTLADVTWTTHTGKNSTIAPGDTGYIEYTIDATGSEVDVLYTATVGTITNAPASGFTVVADSASGTIAYGASMTKTIKFTITWSGDTSDASSKDTSDMNANDKTLTIPVTLTARQKLSTD